MFDKLDDMLIHYEELMRMLGDPDVTQDTKRFTNLMKEQAELARLLERVYQRSKEESKAGFIHLSQYLAQKGGEQ